MPGMGHGGGTPGLDGGRGADERGGPPPGVAVLKVFNVLIL